MPYKIKKFKYGFRAVDNSGVPLSNKPMTKKMVEKQIIAVHLSKLRKTGKSNVFK
jgi:hypothetical protein